MAACSVCGGRTIQSPEGLKCMNDRCDGSKVVSAVAATGVSCSCGSKMKYKGSNSWGEPTYGCPACGKQLKL